ncbi:MAG TPA: hypothetical protein VFA26_13730, partial [Gemmataceae bacterium]|nr:hypothetical protein [Gemmataceae bacterium]
MLGPVNAVDWRSLFALAAPPRLHGLAAIPGAGAAGPIAAGRPVGSLGADLYIPSAPPAAGALTYNRFGRLDDTPTARPAVDLSGASPAWGGARLGYTPAQVARAYGFDQTGLNGAGQTIAVVTAYNSPTVAQDLGAFDRAFALPDPSLRVVNQAGGAPAGPGDSGWALETALDVEWAHAIAPRANVLVVQANSASVADLTTAIDCARHQPGVSVVSMSFGATEFPGQLRSGSILTTPPGHAGITFVAASGDSGAGTLWPP